MVTSVVNGKFFRSIEKNCILIKMAKVVTHPLPEEWKFTSKDH